MTNEHKFEIPVVPRRKLTLLNFLSYLVFGGAIVIVLYFFYLLFYPFNPLTINSVKIDSGSVVVGDSILYTINSCKHTNITPIVYRKITSTNVAESLMTSNGVLSSGCSIKTVPILIPKATPTGSYTLHTEVVYQVNAVRDIHVFWQVGPFQVTQ